MDRCPSLRADKLLLQLQALEALKSCHVDLVVEVASVANNGMVLHLLHVTV